jgi:hypothetical protein
MKWRHMRDEGGTKEDEGGTEEGTKEGTKEGQMRDEGRDKGGDKGVDKGGTKGIKLIHRSLIRIPTNDGQDVPVSGSQKFIRDLSPVRKIVKRGYVEKKADAG